MFPSNFLTDLARKYELSPEQEEVFVLWWGNGKDDREISEQLHVTADAIRSRKTGIYKKLSIAGEGANKANKLRNWLDSEAKKQNAKSDIQSNLVELELQIQVQEVKQKVTELEKSLSELNGSIEVNKSQSVELERQAQVLHREKIILEKSQTTLSFIFPMGEKLQKLNGSIEVNKSQSDELKQQAQILLREKKVLEDRLIVPKQCLKRLLDILVRDVRQKIADDVTNRCGTMRVLDMTKPVDLARIYTDVNILEKISGKDRIDCDEVLPIGNRENFERWMMGKIQHRINGLKAFEKHQKLVVLGKPGAGKTTFMKYLAMFCLEGKFHGELVPIFVTLKAYAEERGQPSLENYILTEFQKREVAVDVLIRLLKEGRALILLDGLDEVKKEDDRRVKQDIDKFSRDWLKNRFAITCRIAAREYQFEKFTEVEVADFDDQQIVTFVNNWFREGDESKAERMLDRLTKNKPVKELATNPLLLTLLCLVFGERNDFPQKRSELYKEGLEVLMKKWDAKRNIEREAIYKHLSPQNKEDMLGQIAFNSFVKGEYFFRQEDLQRQVKDYICNLPDTSADPDALRLDSEVVLKAIEHHHGLLVERARNIYSFSHLTFQEYFAAKAIERGQQLEILVQNISNPRWKEVFYLTTEMLWRSDDFLKMMKDRIDGMFAGVEKLQAFLEWADQKTNSVKLSYKNVAIRAFYAYFQARIRARVLTSTVEGEGMIEGTLALALDHVLALDLNTSLLDLDLAIALALDRAVDIHLSIVIVRAIEHDLDLVSNLGDDLLRQEMQALKSKLPSDREDFYQWRKNHGEEWTKELRQVCIDRRNIGHDWQFTDEQLELLNQYYAANLLLVECMNRSYVSKQVREEIESTMLLPSKK